MPSIRTTLTSSRLPSLLSKLEQIRVAYDPLKAEIAMTDFTCELLQLKHLQQRRLETTRMTASPLPQHEYASVSSPQMHAVDSSRSTMTQCPSSSSSISHSLLFYKGDENLLSDLASYGALAIILRSMGRFLSEAETCAAVSPEFFQAATMALTHFLFKSPDRAKFLYAQGAIPVILDMMHLYRIFDFVQIMGFTTLMVLNRSLEPSEEDNPGYSYPRVSKSTGSTMWKPLSLPPTVQAELEAIILQQIVFTMECHYHEPQVYAIACSALRSLLTAVKSGRRKQQTVQPRILVDIGTPQEIIDIDTKGDADLSDPSYWLGRGVLAVSYGLLVHTQDRSSQDIGHSLLCMMLGPDCAEEMMWYVERRHDGRVCAAAA